MPSGVETAAKRHAHNVRALNRTKSGKAVLDYLVKQAGFFETLQHEDQKKQNTRVAERDFVVRHIVNPINKGA